jgi:hypothetical protein
MHVLSKTTAGKKVIVLVKLLTSGRRFLGRRGGGVSSEAQICQNCVPRECHTNATRMPLECHTNATRMPHGISCIFLISEPYFREGPENVLINENKSFGGRARKSEIYKKFHVAFVWHSCGIRVAFEWHSCGIRAAVNSGCFAPRCWTPRRPTNRRFYVSNLTKTMTFPSGPQTRPPPARPPLSLFNFFVCFKRARVAT